MFERYTMQARRAVFYALANAIDRSADSIGTADLLAGLAQDDSARANQVAPLKDRIADVFALIGLPCPSFTEVKPRSSRNVPLDGNVKLSMIDAAAEADSDSQQAIDTDHLLRGILRGTNKTSEALQSVGINLDSVREASRRIQVECGPSTPGPPATQ